jgi:hypothetical protein
LNPLAPVVVSFLPAAIVAAEHYAPWRRWLRNKPLPPLAAYVLGTLAILIPATLAANPRQQKDTVTLFWGAAISAGVATCAAWGIDELNERAAKRADQLDRLTHGK